LIDEMGGLEFKAPDPETHLKYWNEGPGTQYKCQVQGAMAITDLPMWRFVSYSPNLPEVALTFKRDDDFCAKLETCLNQFCADKGASVDHEYAVKCRHRFNV
jgi:hypothetical protein